jgi:hypothetical protein
LTRQLFVLSAVALLLYFSHIYWFLLGCGVLVVSDCFRPLSLTHRTVRWLSLAPAGVLVCLWYPTFADSGFDSPTLWQAQALPWQRISPTWVVDSALGGLKGPVETVLFALVVVWLAWSAWTHRRGFFGGTDRTGFVLGLLFLLLFFLLPDLYRNSTGFSQRWLPPAMVCFLMAFPMPKRSSSFLVLPLAALWISFTLVNASFWITFETTECDGLRQSLDALPENQRIVGLDFLKESSTMKGNPFIHFFALGQVEKGGEVNTSFADFGTGLVVYRSHRDKRWTRSLEWLPQEVKDQDFDSFDFALVGGSVEIHQLFQRKPFNRFSHQ